jgi:hypothetical protein
VKSGQGILRSTSIWPTRTGLPCTNKRPPAGPRPAPGAQPFSSPAIPLQRIVQASAQHCDGGELSDVAPGGRHGGAQDVGCQGELEAERQPSGEAQPHLRFGPLGNPAAEEQPQRAPHRFDGPVQSPPPRRLRPPRPGARSTVWIVPASISGSLVPRRVSCRAAPIFPKKVAGQGISGPGPGINVVGMLFSRRPYW